jgi:hypothetical protein
MYPAAVLPFANSFSFFGCFGKSPINNQTVQVSDTSKAE